MKYFICFLVFFALAQQARGQETVQKIDDVFQHISRQQPTATALLVIQHDKILYRKVNGLAHVEHQVPADSRTNFRMASVSKQFTAAAVYLLMQRGKISPDLPLTNFFEDFDEVGKKMTIHHLLTHTSGIIDYEEIMPAELNGQLSDADVLEMVKGVHKTYFEAGTQFRYSNTAYCLLSLIVEQVTSQAYSEFMEEQVFKPLRMDHTALYESEKNTVAFRAWGYASGSNNEIIFSDQSRTSATKGDGGVYTSLDDYEKWFRYRASRLGIRGRRLFKRSNAPVYEQVFYSFGWFVHKTQTVPTVWAHTGSTCGFSNVVIEIPAHKTLVVYFTNLANNHEHFYDIEQVLIQEKVLPSGFSLRKMHERTN